MNNHSIITEFASAEIPKFLEKKNQNIVYFGVDNIYPFELIDLYNDSSTHNAIINGKVGYTVGNGLYSEDLATKKWLSFANIDEDWTSLLKRISLDYELFNGYAIEVIKTGVGNQYHHIDFANIRVGLDGGLQYSDEWITDKGLRNGKPKIQYLDRYNPKDQEQKRGVIYHVDYRPNLKYYPLPVYVGSLAEIKTDVQIGDYWLNEVKNGFVGGTLIQHNNGVPETQAEAKEFEETFQEKFGKATGTKIVHLFAPSKENGSEISNLNGNDLHERYLEMSNRVKESIFIGHRVTNPILFGVKEAGQLGARNELDLAYEIFTNTYIAERQNTLLRTIKKLAFYEIQKSDIEIIPLKPIDSVDLTSDIILANLTRAEIRDLINDQTGLELAEEVAAPVAPVALCSHFSDDSDISHLFDNIGVSEDDYEEIEAFDIHFDSDGSPMEFATTGQGIIQRVLKAILTNPLIQASGISSALELTFPELITSIGILKDSKLIEITGEAINLTPTGKKVAEVIDVPQTEVKYKYTLRSDAPALKGESRDFCRKMMGKRKLYSKAEIELLRNDMKTSSITDVTDVWLARGGWYRKPETETSIPYCRHIWKQVIVRKK
tara:strand:- start:381 stop:2198 length:1818 start_codon:yes stop_codon:yes gene_type:complete